MMMRRILVGSLAVIVAVGSVPAMAQQTATGVLSGRTHKEVEGDFTEHHVQLRSVETGLVLSTIPVDAQGLYTFSDVAIGAMHVVELVHTQRAEILCTETHTLTPTTTSHTALHFSCGGSGAWLLLAAAGLPALVMGPRGDAAGITTVTVASADR